MAVLLPIVPRAETGWAFVVPLMIAGAGLGLLVSQLNNYTLSPISEERVSEAAGVNSAAGSFGLSFGLAFAGALMLATLSLAFTTMAEDSEVLSPAEQEQVSQALEDDAELVSNTKLTSSSPGNRPTSRRRSSASTPTRGLVPSRSRCSCRSSPALPGWRTRCGCAGSPTPSHRARPRAWPSADRRRGSRHERVSLAYFFE